MTFPWEPHYDPGVPLTVGPVTTSLPRLLLQAAEQSPQSPALVFFGRTTTYGKLNTRTASLASALITETCARQGIEPGQLTIHADRGSSMTSKPVAFLMADLGVTSRGTPVLVNRTVAEAGLVVSIGCIEPHIIASFGGGYKNLVPGVAEGRHFRVGTVALPLPVDAPRSGELLLGVRPEHADIDPAHVAGSGLPAWPLQVELLEMLGAERLVYGKLGGEPFVLRIDGTLKPPAPGDVVPLQVLPERLHWFDRATGRRVG